jgi:hypothetical protein
MHHTILFATGAPFSGKSSLILAFNDAARSRARNPATTDCFFAAVNSDLESRQRRRLQAPRTAKPKGDIVSPIKEPLLAASIMFGMADSYFGQLSHAIHQSTYQSAKVTKSFIMVERHYDDLIIFARLMGFDDGFLKEFSAYCEEEFKYELRHLGKAESITLIDVPTYNNLLSQGSSWQLADYYTATVPMSTIRLRFMNEINAIYFPNAENPANPESYSRRNVQSAGALAAVYAESIKEPAAVAIKRVLKAVVPEIYNVGVPAEERAKAKLASLEKKAAKAGFKLVPVGG